MNNSDLIKLKEKILKYKEDYGEKLFLENFEKDILSLNNCYLSYILGVYFYSSDKLSHQNIIVNSKNLDLNYLFAKKASGIDVLNNGKVILDSKNVKYNYLFAKDVIIKDKEPFAKVVLESENVDYIYLFALYVNGINKITFANHFLKIGRYDLICSLKDYFKEDKLFLKYFASLNIKTSFDEEKKQKCDNDTEKLRRELIRLNH